MRWCLLVLALVSWAWMGCEDDDQQRGDASAQGEGRKVTKRRVLPTPGKPRLSSARRVIETKIKALTARMTSRKWRGRRWYTPQAERACRSQGDAHGALLLPMVGRHPRRPPVLGARLLICGKTWLPITGWELQVGTHRFVRKIPASQVFFDALGKKKQAHLDMFAGMEHPYVQTFLRRLLYQMSKRKQSTLVMTHGDKTTRIRLRAQKLTKQTLKFISLLRQYQSNSIRSSK